MNFNIVSITNEDDGIRLDRFFKRHHPNISFAIIAKAIRTKKIKLNGKRCEISTRLNQGDELSYPEFKIVEQSDEPPTRDYPSKHLERLAKTLQQNIVFEDDDVIAFNKPAGVAVQGGTNINASVDRAVELFPAQDGQTPKLVHRIDAPTSGLLVLAKKTSIAAKLSEVLRLRQADKYYLAVTVGVPAAKTAKLVTSIAKKSKDGFEKMENDRFGKKAITKYLVLDHAAKDYSLLLLKIETGRTHQIRQQLAEIGAYILGDDKYGKRSSISSLITDKLYLHAFRMTFSLNNKNYKLDAPLPKYFEDALNNLGLNVKNLDKTDLSFKWL